MYFCDCKNKIKASKHYGFFNHDLINNLKSVQSIFTSVGVNNVKSGHGCILFYQALEILGLCNEQIK